MFKRCKMIKSFLIQKMSNRCSLHKKLWDVYISVKFYITSLRICVYNVSRDAAYIKENVCIHIIP